VQLNFTDANSAAPTILSTTVGPAYAVGVGDVVYNWDAPARAAHVLRQRVATLQARAAYATAKSPSSIRTAGETAAAVYERAQTMYHLGLALMRNEPNTNCDTNACLSGNLALADPLTEAAAAFASAAALGSPAAAGALEEVLWLSAAHRTSLHRTVSEPTDSDDSHRSNSSGISSKLNSSDGSRIQSHQPEPLPLFPCSFNGPLQRIIPTAAPARGDGFQGSAPLKERLAAESEWLNMSVNLMLYSSWGHTQAMFTEVIATSCKSVLSSSDIDEREQSTAADRAAMIAQKKAREAIGGDCVTRGIAVARRELARVCGDVGNLASVLAVRTEEPTDINEVVTPTIYRFAHLPLMFQKLIM